MFSIGKPIISTSLPCHYNTNPKALPMKERIQVLCCCMMFLFIFSIASNANVLPSLKESPTENNAKKTRSFKFLNSARNLLEIEVRGKVTSQENGESLPGVNVIIKGTSTGTITDLEGNYVITAPEDGILLFSYIGYDSQEVPVGNRATINIAMA